MKRSFTILLLVLFAALTGAAQKDEDQEQSIKKSAVPKAVLAAFEKAYPHATVKGYSKEMENGVAEYELESQDGKVSRDISYAQDGSVLAVEESMAYADLPEAVRATITKDHPKSTVASCEKVTKGSTIQYEVLMKQGKKKTEVVFDASGSVVKKEEKGKK
jgi:uncharacterized iron-regulated membrane protein